MKVKGLSLLIKALIMVESSGNDHAIGDRHLTHPAYGLLQIRQPVCDDYNRAHGTTYRVSCLIGQRAVSVKICRWYLDYYGRRLAKAHGRSLTLEDYARIWNGGPDGARKQATMKYWHRVKRVLTKERRTRCGKR